MKNRDYWIERFKQLEESQNRKGAECIAEIEKQYRQAQRRIEEKIDRWYQRFADNNGISMQEARILLSGKDLEEFKWDVQDYIRHGKENAANGKWMKQLENASGRYHISRLEAINLQIQQSIETLHGRQLGSIEAAMRDAYINGYYHTAFEIQKGVGVAWNFATLDERTINKVIHNPWAADGKNFSERIWQNSQRLTKELNKGLVQNIILGEDPQKAIDAIAKKMNTSKTNAGRLVMTEEAFFSSAAQKDCFNELGVEQYEIVATLDSHTSDICQAMDGKVFPMSEYEPGITAPPFHVWCRSTTVPAFGDEFGNMGKRAARGEDGKTYYVPADMTYQEWKETLIGGEDESALGQIPQISDERIRKANEEFSQILNSNESTSFSDKMILYNGATEYELNEGLGAPFAYDPKRDVIQYNPSAQNFEYYDMNFVQAHELSHRMDILEYHSWENERFLQAIENTRQKVYDNSEKITDWFSEGGKYDGDIALADIFSALSVGELNEVLCGGHRVEYWQEDSAYACLEIFANMGSIDVMDYKSKEEFSGILKELYEAYIRSW